jgi:hypothetical protein
MVDFRHASIDALGTARCANLFGRHREPRQKTPAINAAVFAPASSCPTFGPDLPALVPRTAQISGLRAPRDPRSPRPELYGLLLSRVVRSSRQPATVRGKLSTGAIGRATTRIDSSLRELSPSKSPTLKQYEIKSLAVIPAKVGAQGKRRAVALDPKLWQ